MKNSVADFVFCYDCSGESIIITFHILGGPAQHSTDSTTGYTKHTVHWLHHQVQVSEYYGKRRSMGQKSKVSYTAFEVLIKTRLYTFNPNNFATLLINLAGCPIRLQSRTYLLCTFTTTHSMVGMVIVIEL